MHKSQRYLHRMKVVVSCLLTLLCTLTACVPAPEFISGPAVYGEAIAQRVVTTCRFPLPDYLPIECFDLDVPENYSHPQGRRIRLHVAIVSSRSERPASDPLVILYGGPGANTLDRLEKTVELFDEVLKARDIILYDQRGVGYSQPSLNCPEIDAIDVTVIDEQLDDIQELERRLAAYRICRDRLEASGVVLQDYSAAALASDLSSLRQVLGYEEWNLYGVSYGARQALIFMRDYPDGLRSVVLDSVYPLDIDLAKETAVTYAHALELLFAANEELHPQFEQAFFDLVSELDTAPVNVPALIPERWIYPYHPFDGDDLLRLTIGIISRWPQSLSHIPGFIDDIIHGNYADLMELARPSVGDQLFSEGMNLSVVCQEIDPVLQKLNGDGEYPVAPRVLEHAKTDVEKRRVLCKMWLGEDRPFHYQTPVASRIPALILRGEQDALIPSLWDAQATEGLSTLVRLTFAETGHGVFKSNRCARETVAAFLLDPTMMPNVECLNEEKDGPHETYYSAARK